MHAVICDTSAQNISNKKPYLQMYVIKNVVEDRTELHVMFTDLFHIKVRLT